MGHDDGESDPDFEDLLSDDEDDETLLKKIKYKSSDATIKNPNVTPSSKTLQEKNSFGNNTKSKVGVSFDDGDGNDLLDDLGFNDVPKKNNLSRRRSSKSVLDDLLGFNEKIEIKPPVQLSIPEKRTNKPKDEPIFGSYQPSTGSSKPRSTSGRSVRFMDEVKSKEENVKPEEFKLSADKSKTPTAPNNLLAQSNDELLEQKPLSSNKDKKTSDWLNPSSVNQQKFSPTSDYNAKKSDDLSFLKETQSLLSSHNSNHSAMKSSEPRAIESPLSRNIPIAQQTDRYHQNLTDIPKINDKFQEMIANLEMKVKYLEMKNMQYQTTTEILKESHQQELKTVNESNAKHLKLTQEMSDNNEARYKTENQLLIKQLDNKIAEHELDKKQAVEKYQTKLDQAHKEKIVMADRMNELHQKTIDELKDDHQSAILRLKEIKECEVNAALSSQNHLRSIQSVLDHLQNNSKELSQLQSKFKSAQTDVVANKQHELKIKEKQLQDLENRLVSQQSEVECERNRLQSLILKLEKRIEDEKVSYEEDRWKLVQQRNQLNVEREALSQERQVLEERISKERSQLDRAKQSILDEQKMLVERLCDEHRNLANERAQIAGRSKLLTNEELDKSFKSMKVAAEYEGTLNAVKEEARNLEFRKKDLLQEHQNLSLDKQKINKEKYGLELERKRLNELGMELKKRSREVEEMCKQVVQDRVEGEKALQDSLTVENEHSQRLEAIQKQLSSLHLKERQISKERQALKLETKSLEERKTNLLCSHCLAPVNDSYQSPKTSQIKHCYSEISTIFSPQLVDWRSISQKDREFLEEESLFLSKLQSPSNLLMSTKDYT